MIVRHNRKGFSPVEISRLGIQSVPFCCHVGMPEKPRHIPAAHYFGVSMH